MGAQQNTLAVNHSKLLFMEFLRGNSADQKVTRARGLKWSYSIG